MHCPKIAGIECGVRAQSDTTSTATAPRESLESTLAIFDALSEFPVDFMAEGRQDSPPQERDAR